jgi:diphosphomevalonate decarboxylase
MKASAIANSNIAFVKYWGKKDARFFIPTRTSISMTISGLKTHTTVEFSKDFKEDLIIIDGIVAKKKEAENVVRFLEIIRNLAKVKLKAKVVSKNNFPKSAGLASSASGFAALTIAATEALGLELDKRQLSILSRLGSGSSCRSIYGGYVKWVAGNSSNNSYAYQLYDENYWDLRDLIVIVGSEEKKISSREGMEISKKTSPIYTNFVKIGERNVKMVENWLKEKKFENLGKIIELESFLLHAVMMTSNPPLMYWLPETIKIIQEVKRLREEGIEAYHTIDAGPNVHIITLPEYRKEIEERLKEKGKIGVIHSKVGKDAKSINKHLF